MISETLRRHLSDSWPDRGHEDFRWERGPVEEALPGFTVRRVSPHVAGHPHIYLSTGAFAADVDVMREFFLLSPVETPRHVETLALVAHFHSFPAHRLSHGSVLDLGRPWLEGVEFQHLFVSWPYGLDPRAARYVDGVAEVVYLWLIPISAGEAEVVAERGSEALEDAFEQSGVDLADPARPSLFRPISSPAAGRSCRG